MSLDKGIEHGKEHRKPYRGWQKFNSSTRNHGSDPWDRSNRTHKFDVGDKASKSQLEELNPRNRTSNGKKSHKRNWDKWFEQMHVKNSRIGNVLVHWNDLPKDKKVE